MNVARAAIPAERIGVIAVVPDHWHDIWMPRHQVLHRLGRHFETVWVEPALGWREYWLKGKGGAEVVQDVAPDFPGFHVYDPGRWLPEVHNPRWLGDVIRRRRLEQARRTLLAAGCSKIILYLWRPEFDWALDAVRADFTCYHIDDEYQFSTEDKPNDPREVELIRRVDQVIIHSRKLFEKKGALNRNTVVVPNGVDYPAYSTPQPEPADLARIPHPRMGYVGVVKSQLDFGLLLELARRRPQWQLVLVGPRGHLGEKAALLDELGTLGNVHLLGNRPVPSLPAYVQHMDTCLMCYEVSDYTNFIYPLKLHEYLATGRPVVATPIDSVLPFGDVVQIAATVDAWEQALESSLEGAALHPNAIAARRRRAAEHDWEALVARIANQFRSRLE